MNRNTSSHLVTSFKANQFSWRMHYRPDSSTWMGTTIYKMFVIKTLRPVPDVTEVNDNRMRQGLDSVVATSNADQTQCEAGEREWGGQSPRPRPRKLHTAQHNRQSAADNTVAAIQNTGRRRSPHSEEAATGPSCGGGGGGGRSHSAAAQRSRSEPRPPARRWLARPARATCAVVTRAITWPSLSLSLSPAVRRDGARLAVSGSFDWRRSGRRPSSGSAFRPWPAARAGRWRPPSAGHSPRGCSCRRWRRQRPRPPLTCPWPWRGTLWWWRSRRWWWPPGGSAGCGRRRAAATICHEEGERYIVTDLATLQEIRAVQQQITTDQLNWQPAQLIVRCRGQIIDTGDTALPLG